MQGITQYLFFLPVEFSIFSIPDGFNNCAFVSSAIVFYSTGHDDYLVVSLQIGYLLSLGHICLREKLWVPFFSNLPLRKST